MKKIFNKIDGWVFGRIGGKIIVDSMAVYSRYEKGMGSRRGYLDIYCGRERIPDKFKHAWNFKNRCYTVV